MIPINNSSLVEMTPEQLGFKSKSSMEGPVDNRDDVEKALDKFDQVILPKKIEEMRRFNEILEETGGNISKQEMNELLGQGYVNELLGSKPIPLNTAPMRRVEQARKKANIKLEDDEERAIKPVSNNSDEIDEIDRFLGSVKTGFEEEDEDDF